MTNLKRFFKCIKNKESVVNKKPRERFWCFDANLLSRDIASAFPWGYEALNRPMKPFSSLKDCLKPLPSFPFSKPPVAPQCLSLTRCFSLSSTFRGLHSMRSMFFSPFSLQCSLWDPITFSPAFLYFHVRVGVPPVCKQPDTSSMALSPCKISARPLSLQLGTYQWFKSMYVCSCLHA